MNTMLLSFTTASNFYAILLPVPLLLLTLLFLLKRKSFFSASSSSIPSLISDSTISNLRTSKTVTDADLKFLMESLDENLNENDKWEDVIDKRNHHICYKAKSCKPKVVSFKCLAIVEAMCLRDACFSDVFVVGHTEKQYLNWTPGEECSTHAVRVSCQKHGYSKKRSAPA